MLLAELSETSRQVKEIRGRLKKIALLADCLRRLTVEEVLIGTAYLTGDLPQGRIGIGGSAIRALDSSHPAADATLTLQQVNHRLGQIATTSGRGSAAQRRQLLQDLFNLATSAEQMFLAPLLYGELRQGALEGILTEAVASAANVPVADVRRALMLSGQLGPVAVKALAQGSAGLAEFTIELFRPLQPMLAGTAADPSEAAVALGQAAFEFKLDGARIQAHRRGDEVKVFTRQLNEVTAAVPEVVAAVRALPVDQIILDGEVIALGTDGHPHPFQVTMRRFGRKLDVEGLREAIPLTPFFFDILHQDGRDLIGEPLVERLARLDTLIPSVNRVSRLITADADAAEAFFDEALARGHEGLVAKALNSAYEAGRRGSSWLKIKPAETLDLVVLAAEWGSGRRQGWLSNLHLGARDPDSGGFIMLGKTFKGLTDALLTWQTAQFLQRETHRDDYTVYLRPELVVEILFDGLQVSAQYPGGLALRFARVKRYRPDKTAAEADTIERVREIAGGNKRRTRAAPAAE